MGAIRSSWKSDSLFLRVILFKFILFTMLFPFYAQNKRVNHCSSSRSLQKEWKKPFELLFCSFALKQELFAWKPKSQFPTLLYSHFLKLARMHSITPPYWMYINPKSEKTPEPEPIKKGLALLYQHCSQYCITVIYIFCKIKLISSLHTFYYAL